MWSYFLRFGPLVIEILLRIWNLALKRKQKKENENG